MQWLCQNNAKVFYVLADSYKPLYLKALRIRLSIITSIFHKIGKKMLRKICLGNFCRIKSSAYFLKLGTKLFLNEYRFEEEKCEYLLIPTAKKMGCDFIYINRSSQHRYQLTHSLLASHDFFSYNTTYE